MTIVQQVLGSSCEGVMRTETQHARQEGCDSIVVITGSEAYYKLGLGVRGDIDDICLGVRIHDRA